VHRSRGEQDQASLSPDEMSTFVPELTITPWNRQPLDQRHSALGPRMNTPFANASAITARLVERDAAALSRRFHKRQVEDVMVAAPVFMKNRHKSPDVLRWHLKSSAAKLRSAGPIGSRIPSRMGAPPAASDVHVAASLNHEVTKSRRRKGCPRRGRPRILADSSQC